MVLGTQWYILFNVIAGRLGVPGDLRRGGAATSRVGGLAVVATGERCRRVSTTFVTGAITASGGSWNAAIVAEVATCRRHKNSPRTASAPISRRRPSAGDYRPRRCSAIAR
jgi:ABC-type anion transport system duplicated permease subunit